MERGLLVNSAYLGLAQGEEEGSDLLEYHHGELACGRLEAAEQHESKALHGVEDAAVRATL